MRELPEWATELIEVARQELHGYETGRMALDWTIRHAAFYQYLRRHIPSERVSLLNRAVVAMNADLPARHNELFTLVEPRNPNAAFEKTCRQFRIDREELQEFVKVRWQLLQVDRQFEQVVDDLDRAGTVNVQLNPPISPTLSLKDVVPSRGRGRVRAAIIPRLMEEELLSMAWDGCFSQRRTLRLDDLSMNTIPDWEKLPRKSPEFIDYYDRGWFRKAATLPVSGHSLFPICLAARLGRKTDALLGIQILDRQGSCPLDLKLFVSRYLGLRPLPDMGLAVEAAKQYALAEHDGGFSCRVQIAHWLNVERDHKAALDMVRRFLTAQRWPQSRGTRRIFLQGLVEYAEARRCLGQSDAAERILQHVLKSQLRNRIVGDAVDFTYPALVRLLHADRKPESLRYLETSLRFQRNLGSPVSECRSTLMLARLSPDRADEAKRTVARLRDTVEALLQDPTLAQILDNEWRIWTTDLRPRDGEFFWGL